MGKNGRTRKAGAAAAACAVIAGGLFYLSFFYGSTASASPVPDLLSELPAGASSLVYLDLAAVRASSFYQHRPDKGPIAVPNQDYADFVSSTGFDFEKDLDRVVMASWDAPPSKEPRKMVAIAEGRFDRAKIRDYALRKGKVEVQQGHDVFLFPGNDRLGIKSLTFLDDQHIAIVDGPSIAPLFAGSSGDAAAADPVRDRAARLDGAAVFAISRVPPIPDNATLGGSKSAAAGQLMTLARSVQWVTMAARPEGDNLRVSLEGECDTPTDAMQIKSMLEVLRMFGSAALGSPKTSQSMDAATLASLQSLLSSAEVTQSAERVRILIELTPDIFKLGATRKPQ